MFMSQKKVPKSLLSFGLLLGLSACGGGLYAPCQNNIDCAGDGLRCVQLGDQFGAMCTRTCTISRNRAGLPDAIDENEFFEDGSSHNQTVCDSDCADAPVEVTTQDGQLEYS
ncbi:MAG: hypothetical protein GY822_28250 [Deltaproteobacteria bacterium]|nr:hypothetical protein [Deltaproteobacteria bacterium]